VLPAAVHRFASAALGAIWRTSLLTVSIRRTLAGMASVPEHGFASRKRRGRSFGRSEGANAGRSKGGDGWGLVEFVGA